MTLQFIGASGLPKMDVVGSADPYFVAGLDDKIRFVYAIYVRVSVQRLMCPQIDCEIRYADTGLERNLERQECSRHSYLTCPSYGQG